MARKLIKSKYPIPVLPEAIRESIKLGVEIIIKNENGKIRVTGVNRMAGESCSKLICYGTYLKDRLSVAITENFRHFYD